MKPVRDSPGQFILTFLIFLFVCRFGVAGISPHSMEDSRQISIEEMCQEISARPVFISLNKQRNVLLLFFIITSNHK